MSLDVTLLRLCRRREKYEALAGRVPEAAVGRTTQLILRDFGRYFAEMPDVLDIQPEPFSFWFKLAHPTLTADQLAICQGVIDKLGQDVEPEVEAGLLGRLAAASAAVRVSDLIMRWNQGDEVDLYADLRSEVERLEIEINRRVKNPQVLDPIEDILSEEENDAGLKWRLSCLNRHIKPLRGGDFVIVGARPDVGKTSFCASELTYMAPQVDQQFPGQNRSILWFNNEGPGKRIVLRNFQAALGVTVEDLLKYSKVPADPEWNARNNRDYTTRVRQMYAEALGGRPGVLRVMNIHDMWHHEVEDLIARYNPALVLFDMVDNIRFGGSVINNGERTDQLLEAMYQWARMLAVKYDCACIATSQISAEGADQQYPAQHMLKDSRTGKQGAADVIITLGVNPAYPSSRYIGCTKNKKRRTGAAISPNQEVIFDGDTSRYKEIE